LIQKKQSFTVKITGGPDGDVGGNMLRILNREYGENCKIVGIADATGCVEDPNGLNWGELLRLTNENNKDGVPIAFFDENKLSPTGKLYKVKKDAQEVDEGTRMRNTLHNRIKSDVFIPCGGRPDTINETNYREFLDQNGKPTSTLIVEGANLFITEGARDKLFKDHGVKIIKDSSANKCGVMCSNFEIICSMLLEENEFIQYKDLLAKDVVRRLREMALLEANLLYLLFINYPGSLPEMSMQISGAKNRVKDVLERSLKSGISEQRYEHLLELFKKTLPNKLAEVAFDRVKNQIPKKYLIRAFATSLANELVYNEGIRFVDAQPEKLIPELCFQYLEKKKEVNDLIKVVNEIPNLNNNSKNKIIELLVKGGPRASLSVY